MADEKAIASSEGNPVASIAPESATAAAAAAAADSHKRKLDDLELNNAPEPPAESDPNSNADAVNNGTQEQENGGADESETKRPRLESNGENVSEADGPVSQNGHQEEEKKDEPKEKESADVNLEEEVKKDELKEEVSEQPESADANVKSMEDEEPTKEPLEAVTPEPASNEDEKTEINSSNELGQPIAETEEASVLPREGDIPVHSESQPGSGRQILSRKMVVPNDKVGVLIGKAGDTIRSLQDNSGAKIQIMRDADADPRSTTRPLELVGTLEDINKAEKLIKGVIAEADAGGSPSLIARGFNAGLAASGGEQVEIQVPIEKVGLIIGKGGETIRNLQTRSGARIQLIQPNPSDGEQSKERIVRITGSKKQIETAREMIKDVMNQTVRQSPLSSGYSQQQSYRPRGPVAPQWGSRGGPHHAQYSGYDYPQRGPPSYPSQNSQYPQSYGNYPPPIAPRSNYGPKYGHHPPSYSQTQPPQPYSHGYNEAKYDNHAPPQHYGPQPTPYTQGGPATHTGYGPPQDQYGKPPPMYNMQQPQVPPPHAQPYGQQPRHNQPVEAPYQVPAQSYGQNMPPPQQPYPYAPSGPVQQTYPNPTPYGPVPASDGYGQTYPNNQPAAAASSAPSGYGQQSVAGYGPQAGVAQQQPQPQAYPQAGGYGSYPPPQAAAYAEQQQPATANNAATYGYQAPDPAAYGAPPQQGPPAAAVGPGGYAAQPTQAHQPGYDQSGGYGNVAAAAPVVGYGKSGSPQAGYPQQQQYDASQMYGAQHR
ncbi:far upstream element-binding protein 3 [Phtheirospermum japonicum]|uniref:Far upstream element-binding protein 3 n=1 Tax=Phtheirospermum japonicum TaxID=374723 RepID=A0A830D2P5_9LAMI|nr:far upstream element-binding protein 3 [Phtheirospermum japonicum]